MIDGVKPITFPVHGDDRGSLIAIESFKEIDFAIGRIYYIYGTTPDTVRGKHAHKDLKQILVCVRGQCDILIDNGSEREIVRLSSPDQGIYITGFVWREMLNFSSDCVLLAITDKAYDVADYVYDYNEVRAAAQDDPTRDMGGKTK